MRRVVLVLATMAAAIVVLVAGNPAHKQVAAAPKPNIVFILTDDMSYDDLKYMPKTRSVLKNKGMSFQDAFVSHATCCPSRATIMRGQYAHNTGVWTNGGPEGGWNTYRSQGNEQANVATRLDAAGYETGLFGKYLNNYKHPITYVPPGWDEWFATFGQKYFDYSVNDDGTIRHFGTRNRAYKTDVLRRKTQAFIEASAAQGEPFFAYVAPVAPHSPTKPAPRDKHTYDGVKAPRSPSFNEKYLSDKPPWIRQLPRLSGAAKAAIDRRHEKRVESLQAVDDLVKKVVGKLKNTGELSNTYVFFTSDNGWHNGEHRIRKGKWRPYEEDIRVPLLVRGPGVAAGTTTSKLALNTDYLPTFADLAGAQTPSYVDGRSLLPVLNGNATTWRSAILLEAARKYSPAYYGIRTSTGSKYVEYEGGVRELYYLDSDPHELSNKYRAAAPPTALASRLQALERCAGAGCRAAENGQ